MDRVLQQLMPMCEHGFTEPAAEAKAQEQAAALLGRFQAEGLYR